MLRKAIGSVGIREAWGVVIPGRGHSSVASSAVNSMLLRSLKEHYVEVSKMAPPPKVNPPADFTILKGALDSNGPVLKRFYNHEEITISVMRLANLAPDEDDEDDNDDGANLNQLFVHIGVTKPGTATDKSLHFLCGLYPDALGIHSVALRPNQDFIAASNIYTGPMFQNLDEETRDAFHNYIEERGINESLFPFLQAWLYVKDHRNLMRWFRTVGSFINGHEVTKEANGSGESMSAEGA